MVFIYPGNFKEPKTICFLKVYDLIITGALSCGCVIYAIKNLSILPVVFPAVFFIMKVKFLEDGSNLWDKLLDVANYLVSSQQIYFWGVKK